MLKLIAGGLAAAVLLSVSVANAQAQPTARQMELAQRYIAAMQLQKTLASTEAMMTGLIGPGKDAAAEAKRAEFRMIMQEVSAELIGKMSTRMAPVLAETFTEKELEDVVAFYEGPSGRAMIEKQPLLSAKMTPIMLEILPEMIANMRERLCKDGGCPPSATK